MPVSYEHGRGGRKAVEGRFVVLDGGQVGFDACAYDRTRTLIIDPVLDHSTCLGGQDGDVARAIAVDGTGTILPMTSWRSWRPAGGGVAGQHADDGRREAPGH